MIQQCADNDCEVLRRQLRKVRRWQQSLESFCDEDVDDLHLIISAIDRHIRYQYLTIKCEFMIETNSH